MAIRLETFDDQWVEYVPDYGDNRDLDEQCTCEIKPMSVAEWRAVSSQYVHKLTGKSAAKRAHQMMAEILADRCRSITNCWIGQEVTTGAELAELAPPELSNDVFRAIVEISKLQDGLKKK